MSEEGEVNNNQLSGGGGGEDGNQAMDGAQAGGDAGNNGSDNNNNAAGGEQQAAAQPGMEEGQQSQPKVERLIKVLLTSMQAGALIGQGGATVNELQKRTSTRIKVSSKNMYFPGTQFRTIAVEGNEPDVLEAVQSIVRDVSFVDSKTDDDAGEAILAVPSSAAPAIIGKQGSRVTEIIKECGCEVRVGKQADELPGVNERMVNVTGKRANVLKGVLGVLNVMFHEAHQRASKYDNPTTVYDTASSSSRRDDYRSGGGSGRRGGDYRDSRDSYRDRDDDRYRRDDRYGGGGGGRDDDDYGRGSRGGDRDYRGGGGRDRDYRDRRDDRYGGGDRGGRGGGGAPLPPPQQGGGMMPSMMGSLIDGAPGGAPAFSTQVSVPDDFVGAMLGRNGENVAEIQRMTRTRISVSRKGEFVPNTRDRIVTIAGSMQDCEAAKTMLAQRITKSSS